MTRPMEDPHRDVSDADHGEDDDAAAGREATRRTKADVFLETGLTPEEFIVAQLEARDGRLRQQAICDITGWSVGTISRILSEMEDDGSIERVRIGQEKLVFLPGAKSSLVAPPDDDATETH